MEYAIYGQIYIPELGKYKGSVGSCSRVLHVSFSCFHGLEVLLSIYYIVELDWEAWKGKLAVLIKTLWTAWMNY